MKTSYKYMLMAASLLLITTACRKDFEKVDGVSFEARLDSEVFKVGEPVTFHFEGNPNLITFWSGEEGHDYAYVDKDRITDTEMYFAFNASTGSGVVGHANPSSCPISYSTDFSGEYSLEAMNAATWIDITDLFVMPDDTEIKSLYSGDVKVSDFYTDPEKPIYFRFFFHVEGGDYAKTYGRTQWFIQSPQFNGVAGEKVVELYDIVSSGWTFINSENWEAVSPKNWPNINATRFQFNSIFRPTETLESWCISGPIMKYESLNNGPDHGVGIKALADGTLHEYKYTFNEPGEYEVVFVAANANVWDRDDKVVKLKVTIVEDEGSLTPPQPEDWK